MTIHRIEFESFARILVGRETFYQTREPFRNWSRTGSRVLDLPYGQHIIQCENERIAERVRRDLDLEYVSKNTFVRALPMLDYRQFDIGHVLTLLGLPDWNKFRPWLEDNMIGDITATLGTNWKRFSFARDEDYILMKLLYT